MSEIILVPHIKSEQETLKDESFGLLCLQDHHPLSNIFENWKTVKPLVCNSYLSFEELGTQVDPYLNWANVAIDIEMNTNMIRYQYCPTFLLEASSYEQWMFEFHKNKIFETYPFLTDFILTFTKQDITPYYDKVYSLVNYIFIKMVIILSRNVYYTKDHIFLVELQMIPNPYFNKYVFLLYEFTNNTDNTENIQSHPTSSELSSSAGETTTTGHTLDTNINTTHLDNDHSAGKDPSPSSPPHESLACCTCF